MWWHWGLLMLVLPILWICETFIFAGSSGNWPIFYNLRSSTWVNKHLPLPPHDVLLTVQVKSYKAAALRINLNIDDTPISSRSYTHPSHSQTSHLLMNLVSIFRCPSSPHNPVNSKIPTVEISMSWKSQDHVELLQEWLWKGVRQCWSDTESKMIEYYMMTKELKSPIALFFWGGVKWKLSYRWSIALFTSFRNFGSRMSAWRDGFLLSCVMTQLTLCIFTCVLQTHEETVTRSDSGTVFYINNGYTCFFSRRSLHGMRKPWKCIMCDTPSVPLRSSW